MSDEQPSVDKADAPENPVVFFDGTCGLCDGFILFLIEVDQNKVFKFAPLQGLSANSLLPRRHTAGINSVVVLTESGEILTKSTAIWFVFKKIGGLWRALGWFGAIFPKILMDALYDFVSRNRYKWFGRLDACRTPSPDDDSRFMD